MRNDVLDAEKPMLMLADWLEAGRTLDNMYAAGQPLSGQIMLERARQFDALTELDPARIRQLGSLLGRLHPLAVTASSSTGTAAQVRAARDELVRVCLELGGEA